MAYPRFEPRMLRLLDGTVDYVRGYMSDHEHPEGAPCWVTADWRRGREDRRNGLCESSNAKIVQNM